MSLGRDKWTGREIVVESTLFGHGSRCPICENVRRAVAQQDPDFASMVYVLGSDDTNPPVPTGFALLEAPDESA